MGLIDYDPNSPNYKSTIGSGLTVTGELFSPMLISNFSNK